MITILDFYSFIYFIFILSAIVSLISFIVIIIKNPEKIFEQILSISLAVLFFAIPYVIEKNKEKDDSSDDEPPAYATTTEPIAKTDTEKITEEPATDLPVTTTVKIPTIITNNTFSRKFTYADETFNLVFIAPTGGKYRFDFKTDNVDCDYRVILKDFENNIVFKSQYNTYGNGHTCELEKDKRYELILEQSDGFPTATVKIGVPNETAILQINN